MQQKYCDHGRSVELLKITWPMLRARKSCGSGGQPTNASIFPSANSSTGVGEVSQRISFVGSSPTYEAMLARSMYGPEPIAGTPTVLPLRSGMLRMVSLARISKQPTCTPANIVIG